MYYNIVSLLTYIWRCTCIQCDPGIERNWRVEELKVLDVATFSNTVVKSLGSCPRDPGTREPIQSMHLAEEHSGFSLGCSKRFNFS